MTRHDLNVRLSVTIDKELLEAAERHTGIQNRSALIRAALQSLMAKPARVLEMPKLEVVPPRERYVDVGWIDPK